MPTRNYKFRLYPDFDTQNKLFDALNAARWVYNEMISKIRKEGFCSRNDLNYFLTELKEQEPFLYHYNSKMLQYVSSQVHGAQKGLFQLARNGHKTGNLKFTTSERYNTLVYNQSGFKIHDGFLELSKIGSMPIVQHRKIPENAIPKQVVITRSRSGRWHCCVTLDLDLVTRTVPCRTVGIDVGIKNFAYDSDGGMVPNPLILKQMLKPLARVQRKMSRRQKGSQNRKKAIRWYQRIHEKIANRRRDFLHKTSTLYARKYSHVIVEDLKISNMVQNHKLARNIIDSGWGTFVGFLKYKASVIQVPARNTSVQCSGCGKMVPKGLAVRIHCCDVCGMIIDRDYNAALNILQRGIENITAGTAGSYACRDPDGVVEAGRDCRACPVEVHMKFLTMN